jgi:pyruvate ferredoxin oxidoreductase delta subunit
MSNSQLKSWKEIPIGCKIVEPGNAIDYNTGDWRTFKPVRNDTKCSQCLLCWIYCPDSSVIVKEGKVIAIDYKHCKGCGICADICPKKCIEMVKELTFFSDAEKRGTHPKCGSSKEKPIM